MFDFMSLLCSVSLVLVLHFEYSLAGSPISPSLLKCREKCLIKDGFFEDNHGFIKAVSKEEKGWFRTLAGPNCSCLPSDDFKRFLKNKFDEKTVKNYEWWNYFRQGKRARAKMSGVAFHTDGERILGIIKGKRAEHDQAHPGEDGEWDSKPVTSICDDGGCRILKASDLKS